MPPQDYLAPATSTSEALPKPKDLWYHLSRSTQGRAQSNIKAFYKYFAIPGIGQLAGGLPNDHYFPFDTLEAKVARPDRWADRSTPNDPVKPPKDDLDLSKLKIASGESESAHIFVPKDSHVVDRTRKIDLASALQYGQAQGYPPLYNFLLNFVRKNPMTMTPYEGGPDITLTCGSTDGFSKCLQALNNEWIEGRDDIKDKEGLLCEEFAYMSAIGTARPRGMNIAPVAIDDQGMLAYGKGALEEVLENWDTSKGKRPHLMYTVTMGQNPTSGVLSLERRKEIYSLCQKFDVLIIEDDPYWYLQYPSANAMNIKLNRTTASSRPSSSTSTKSSSGYPFLDSMVPSYLAVDIDGRVLRLDTFSKTIAPGCRLGWITAQPALIERILRITETSTQQPSGFVQSMVAELLIGPQTPTDPGRGGREDGSGWDMSGWVRWLEGLRGNYERRMNTMAKILHEGAYLVKAGRRRSLTACLPSSSSDNDDDDEWAVVEKQQIYDFAWPMGGMFLWLHFNFSTHPLSRKFSGPKLARALWLLWTHKPYLVLVSPGTIFGPNEQIREEKAWQYFRLCFAACDEPDVSKISKRFVEGIQAFWRIKDVKRIEELLEEDTMVARGEGAMGEGEDRVGMQSLMGFC